jgi:hypothetical protein
LSPLRTSAAPTRLKLWRNLTEVFYRRFLAILHGVIRAKYNVFFIAFCPLSKTTNGFPNTTMDVRRLN